MLENNNELSSQPTTHYKCVFKKWRKLGLSAFLTFRVNKFNFFKVAFQFKNKSREDLLSISKSSPYPIA